MIKLTDDQKFSLEMNALALPPAENAGHLDMISSAQYDYFCKNSDEHKFIDDLNRAFYSMFEVSR